MGKLQHLPYGPSGFQHSSHVKEITGPELTDHSKPKCGCDHPLF